MFNVSCGWVCVCVRACVRACVCLCCKHSNALMKNCNDTFVWCLKLLCFIGISLNLHVFMHVYQNINSDRISQLYLKLKLADGVNDVVNNHT